MAEALLFSPRRHRSHEIPWRTWGRAAFDDAERSDRPVLLSVTAFWCHWSHMMDETTYSDPALLELIREELVPVRVDADRLPHVHERYAAGGWPTNAFLTPTGEVLWVGAYVGPDRFLEVARGVLHAWRNRRSELTLEIERRRRAMEAARSHQPSVGLVRREAAEEALSAARDSFDAEHGGFGEPPRPPHVEAIELLYAESERGGDAAWRGMAERTLEGVLEGGLRDEVDGGFFHYAQGPGWTHPAREKLLDANAGLLSAYALGAHLAGRPEWRDAAESIVAWADGTLAREDGLWSASQDALEEYYLADAVGRSKRAPPGVDPRLFTDANAAWIRALAESGGRLGREDWIRTAAGALRKLLDTMSAPDDLLYHVRDPDGEPSVPGLLSDLVAAGRACVDAFQATGEAAFLAEARRLAAAVQRSLWAESGGFFDFVAAESAPGALRHPSRPFHLNAAAARLFLDLSLATGERGYRAVAERILAVLSPQAGRHGVAAAEFALAVSAYFEPPIRIVVVGPPAEAAELRDVALRWPRACRRVLHLERGGRIGELDFGAGAEPRAYICRGRTASAPYAAAAALEAALADIG